MSHTLMRRKTDKDDNDTTFSMHGLKTKESKNCNHNGTAMDSVRILVAIRQSILRFGIASLLSEQTDFVVVGTADSCKDCHQKAVELSPHVLLCDLEIAGTSAVLPSGYSNCPLEAQCNEMPDIPAIVLEDDRSDYQIIKASRIEIRGCLTTNTALEDLYRAIRVVKDGGTFLERCVQSKVMDMLVQLHGRENTV